MMLKLCGLIPALALFPTAQPQDPAQAAMQARVDVVNLLVANETADDFFAQGAAARDREEIAPALIAFLTAYRMDNSRFDAAFEVARLFSAWDEEDLAWTWLGHAVDAGYWSEERMTRDSLVSVLRKREGFSELITQARKNLEAALPSLRGLTEVRAPQGDAPAGGWPVLLCLHGYGTDHRDLTGLAEVGASQGFFAICVSGYTPVSPGRYAWPDEGPAIQAYLQEVLRPFGEDPRCDTDKIYTTGFSQGGLVATYLVATEPNRYLGAFPISPAGPLTVPLPTEDDVARPLYILYGTAEGAGVQGNVRRFRQSFEQAGGRVHVETHAGGHSFPDNWREVLGQALAFVRPS